MSAAAKPVMRGFLKTQIKKNLIISFILGAVTCTAHQVFYAQPVKQRYADFYKTYDPMEHFESMRKKGLLQSAGPDDE